MIKNAKKSFDFDCRMNLIFSKREFVELLRGLSVKKYADTILGLPFLRSSIFRRVSVFYFLTIAWTTVYVVFKWSAKAPIIAGKRKRRKRDASKDLLEDVDADGKNVEVLIVKCFDQILAKIEKASPRNSSIETISLQG